MPDACASSAKASTANARLASQCMKTKRLAFDRNFPLHSRSAVDSSSLAWRIVAGLSFVKGPDGAELNGVTSMQEL